MMVPLPKAILHHQLIPIQVNLDMTDSMGPGKLVRHMQNLSYTYDEYLICIGLGPSISSVISKFTCSCLFLGKLLNTQIQFVKTMYSF